MTLEEAILTAIDFEKRVVKAEIDSVSRSGVWFDFMEFQM